MSENNSIQVTRRLGKGRSLPPLALWQYQQVVEEETGFNSTTKTWFVTFKRPIQPPESADSPNYDLSLGTANMIWAWSNEQSGMITRHTSEGVEMSTDLFTEKSQFLPSASQPIVSNYSSAAGNAIARNQPTSHLFIGILVILVVMSKYQFI